MSNVTSQLTIPSIEAESSGLYSFIISSLLSLIHIVLIPKLLVDKKAIPRLRVYSLSLNNLKMVDH